MLDADSSKEWRRGRARDIERLRHELAAAKRRQEAEEHSPCRVGPTLRWPNNPMNELNKKTKKGKQRIKKKFKFIFFQFD